MGPPAQKPTAFAGGTCVFIAINDKLYDVNKLILQNKNIDKSFFNSLHQNIDKLLNSIIYSFNDDKSLILKPYAKKANFYWCQEEPKNMGAWFSVRDYIQWTLDNIKANNKNVSYIGRSPDASPATGYAKRHISQQQEIIKKVFE